MDLNQIQMFCFFFLMWHNADKKTKVTVSMSL